jgi:putative tryptophan/tyrosine transport system substrate-binding protein
MRRREFLAALAGATAAPLVALGQEHPVVGVLGSGGPADLFTAAIAQGLAENGFVEGQNVAIDYRWARGDYARLPAMAAELIERRVAVLLTFGTPAGRVAKAASTKAAPATPVVFSFGSDPVAEGLVASLNRPGGNLTGVTSIAGEIAPKRIELMRELLGERAVLATLINPSNPLSRAERSDSERAAEKLGQRLEILAAQNESEIDAAFTALQERNVAGLIIAVDTFYFGQMRRMATLAAQHRMPAVGPLRDFALGGGLMTYGASIFDVNRQAAVYVGRVLKGAQPAELPVLQPTKFEFLINLKAAKDMGLEVPPILLARADEVIE